MNFKAIAAGSLIFATAWLFFGIEETPREHSTDWESFVKQTPTFRVIFRNPAVCGECDVEPFFTLTDDKRTALAEFCQVRFGLDDVRTCYAIYEERQRLANERMGKPLGRLSR